MLGKTVIITGASRGIGAAAVREFVARGARVAAVARDEAALATLATGQGESVFTLRADVADAAAMADCAARVQARFGAVDVLINNAATIDPIAPLAETDAEAFSRAVDVNVKGVFYPMRAVLPLMRAAGAGTVINLSSGAAVNPYFGWGAYCASKAAVLMLTRTAHLEEAGNGLRILGLSPGTVATNMQRRIRESGINPVSQLDPSVHIPPEWVARALVWMCGSAADDWLGQDVRLRDDAVRKAIGLVP